MYALWMTLWICAAVDATDRCPETNFILRIKDIIHYDNRNLMRISGEIEQPANKRCFPLMLWHKNGCGPWSSLFMAKLFWLWQTDLRAAAAVLCLWGIDLCCHSLCHCLCGQTVKLALSLLAEYYNTANASGDPWKLPSIEMNHTDGRFVIQQNCPSTRPPATIPQYMWHCIRINQIRALQFHLRKRNLLHVL